MANAKQLPGDRTPQDQVASMIRVNHAGEYGAQRIYAGQLAILGKGRCGPMLRHMADQEQEHLDEFSRIMRLRRVRPTLLMPLWHVGGFAMGAATALLGEKAAMACTVAVEAVIDEHYAQQEQQLDEREQSLKVVIEKFRADEKEHHDAALAEGAEQAPFYQALTAMIRAQTKFAIWLSTRI